MATDLTPLVNELQAQTRLLARISQSLSSGLLILPNLTNYTVAALPATAAIGALAYASNGRKSGEGAGSGTGCVVVYDVSTHWFAIWSSLQVTA